MIVFNKAQIKEVVSAASKDSGRMNINCVRIEPGKLIATDGHRLNVVHVGDSSGFGFDPFAISRADAESLIKAMGAKDVCKLDVDAIGCDPREVRADVGAASFTFKAVDSVYPDWQRLIPSGEPERVIYLTPKYLKEVAASVERLSDVHARRGKSVRVEIREDLGALRFSTLDGEFEAILMPQLAPKA